MCADAAKQGSASDVGKVDGSEKVEVVVVPAGQGLEGGDGGGVVVVVDAGAGAGGVGKVEDDNPKKLGLSRCDSTHDECRVCQQQSEEALIDLGCQCRGELAKAHRSCIETWFRTKGSNKCEICQQVAANIPCPEPRSTSNYWVWRIDPAFRRSNLAHGQANRGCYSPLWIAFSILIGGLLLDVLISISLGVSALPVNIIIGVLVVLGLGTALRLAFECCHEWNLRRPVQRVEADVNHVNPAYPLAV